MKMRRLLAQILALVLCAALLCPLTAFAEGEETSAIPAEPESYGVLDPAAMQKLVEDYLKTYGLNKDKISVGYCYLDTGDTWYYNGDRWYFSGGLHRVPLMMILAEWEHDGKLTQDSMLKGMTLGQAEESVLIYNSNVNTHAMMNMIGSDQDCRNEFKKYSSLPDAYYSSDFLEYSHFTARFTMDVLKTLYYENERFPNILECMKRASVGEYFGAGLGGAYEVAQRFGAFNNPEVNHDAGIIYTPHPFALVVMTQDMGLDQQVLRNMAVIFKDYTLTLDEAYDAWVEQQANPQPEATVPEQSETPAAPVEDETVTETPEKEEPAEETQPGGLILPTEPEQTEPEQETAAPEAPAPENLTPEQQEQRAAKAKESSRRTIVLLLGAVLLVILILTAVLKTVMRRRGDEETDEL